MKSNHKNQIRRENADVGIEYTETPLTGFTKTDCTQVEIPHIGLANVAPLTKVELGDTYDELVNSGAELIATRGEFIFRALMRETEILEQDLPKKNST